MISRSELYEALFNRKTVLELSLSLIENGANRRFFALWTEKGYDVNIYKWVFNHSNFLGNSNFDSPNIPTAKNVNREYVLVYLACNDSPEIIKNIMENKLFHAECRRCMNNPKEMESDPSWIRAPTRHAPKLPPVNDVSWIVLSVEWPARSNQPISFSSASNLDIGFLRCILPAKLQVNT